MVVEGRSVGGKERCGGSVVGRELTVNEGEDDT